MLLFVSAFVDSISIKNAFEENCLVFGNKLEKSFDSVFWQYLMFKKKVIFWEKNHPSNDCPGMTSSDSLDFKSDF